MTMDPPCKSSTQREPRHSQENHAMQRYLRYLKSDSTPLNDSQHSYYHAPTDAWKHRPVCYPPYED